MPKGVHANWQECNCVTCQARRGVRPITKIQVTIKINKELYGDVNAFARKREVTTISIIEQALHEYLERQEEAPFPDEPSQLPTS